MPQDSKILTHLVHRKSSYWTAAGSPLHAFDAPIHSLLSLVIYDFLRQVGNIQISIILWGIKFSTLQDAVIKAVMYGYH